MADRNPNPEISFAERVPLLALRAGDGELDGETRARLLAAVRSGQAMPTLRVDAIVYRQPEAPNRNFVRFSSSSLSKLAASFVNMPVLADHRSWDMTARCGTVLESKLVTRDGVPCILQTLELVKPWAVESALDGTLDRFSIGWDSGGRKNVECSVCGESMYGDDCTHWPGATYKLKDRGEVVCEAIYTAAVGVETSAVNVPAVVGTEIEGIRAALAAVRNAGSPARENRMSKFMIQLAAAFALSESASEDEILGAAKDATLNKQLLAAEREAHAGTKSALAAAQAQIEAAAKAARDREVDALILRGKTEGRILRREVDGKEIPSEIEKAVRALADRGGIAAAGELLDSLPKLAPVGGPPVSASQPGANTPAPVIRISDVQRHINKQMGVTDEDFIKYGPQAQGSK